MKFFEFIQSLNEKQLTKNDLLRADRLERMILFTQKVKEGLPFTTVDGRKVKIRPDADFIASIKARIIPSILPIYPNGTIPLSQIQKTEEFGGKSIDDVMKKENKAIGHLKDQIESIKGDKPYIILSVAGKKVKCAGVEKTPGTPKSDFHIVDDKNKPVAYISHKDGSPATPTKFGQWSGLSKFTDIKEVKAFIDELAIKRPKGALPKETALSAPIKSRKLKMMGVYGMDYGSDKFGENNVDVVLQGPPHVTKDGRSYRLTALAEFPNGSKLPKEYNPIIIARYSSDRTDFGFPHTRVSIYPEFGRKTVPLSSIPTPETSAKQNKASAVKSTMTPQEKAKLALATGGKSKKG